MGLFFSLLCPEFIIIVVVICSSSSWEQISVSLYVQLSVSIHLFQLLFHAGLVVLWSTVGAVWDVGAAAHGVWMNLFFVSPGKEEKKKRLANGYK